ncbi:hypothetical protein C8R47DRAFT_1227223 [Mycena vitilis]|nr:hypothetical protein C8R47DRAFT_1227223 [Mycena vitilis]
MFAQPTFCQFTSTSGTILLLFSPKRNALPNFQYVLIISGQITASRALETGWLGRAPHGSGTGDDYTCLDADAVPPGLSDRLFDHLHERQWHKAPPAPALPLRKGKNSVRRKRRRRRGIENGRLLSHSNRAAVLEAGRLRAARRRDYIRKNLRGEAATEALRRVRKASADYRARNREELAARQRELRKRAFIDKHGIHAYIQRRFDAPIPGREDTPDPDVAASAEGQDLDWGGLIDHTYSASSICDYVDPCLKRLH